MKKPKIEKEVEIVEKRIKREWKNIIFNLIFAAATLLAIVVLYKSIALASAIVFLVSLIGLIKWKSKLTIVIFIFIALFGASVEMIAITYGVWHYSLSNFYNIPLWLFIAWGNAGVFVYQTAIEFHKLGVEK